MAKNTNEQIFEELEKLINKATETAVIETGKKVREKLRDQARLGVDRYYAQYDPDIYERTYNLRRNVKHRRLPLQLEKNVDAPSCIVGIEYHCWEDMTPYKDGSFTTEQVFENFWEGEHCNALDSRIKSEFISQTEMMNRFIDRPKFKQDIENIMQQEFMKALNL